MSRYFLAIILILQGCSSGSELQWKPPLQESESSAKAVSKVGWLEIKERFFEAKCVSCHKPGNEKGLIDLTDPKSVRNSIGTIFFVSAVAPSMPPPEKTSNKLTREDILLLSGWIADGTPLTAGGEPIRAENHEGEGSEESPENPESKGL